MAVDRKRRWSAICQAKSDTDGDGRIHIELDQHGGSRGDRLDAMLVSVGAGTEPIDEFVAGSSTGDHIVFVRNSRLVLRAVLTGTELDLTALGAKLPRLDDPSGPHPAASFDGLGGRLLYLRGSGSKQVAAVRDLSTGREVEVSPGDGLVQRARFSEAGQWILFDVSTKGTDASGNVEPPKVRTTLATRRCRGVVDSWGAGKGGENDLVLRVAPSTGGIAREVPDLLRPLGEYLLRRGDDRGLVLERADGQPTEGLAPTHPKAATAVGLGTRLVFAAREVPPRTGQSAGRSAGRPGGVRQAGPWLRRIGGLRLALRLLYPFACRLLAPSSNA